MGRKAAKMFEDANAQGGMVAKIRLASMSRFTSAQAATVDDTPDLLARLADAWKKVQAELEERAAEAEHENAGRISTADSGPTQAGKLRKHVQTFLDLMSQRALFLGDVAETARRVDEASADALEVARVSVWFLDPQRTKITCADLFERRGAKHSAGVELFAKDFPAYFAALHTERTIAAHDAHNDPRTAAFSAPYLAPLGISSMLDVPIWSNGAMAGVVCHEHTGPARTWTDDEETFAYLLASFVSLSLEKR